MKKILFTSLTGYPNPNTGGPNKIIFEILKKLDYARYNPSFFSYDAKIEYKSPEDLKINQENRIFTKRKMGHNLYKKNIFYRYITSSQLYLGFHFLKIDRFFRKHYSFFSQFDVIHIHDSLAAFYFINIAKPKKILTVHSKGSVTSEMKETLNSFYLHNKLDEFREREKIAYKSIQTVTFPSKAARDLYLADLQLSEKQNTVIIYNGIDTEYIKSIKQADILIKYGIEKNKYEGLILNVANHVKPKNIDILIKTVMHIKENYNRNYLLINAGTGYLTSELRKLSKELKVTNLINFLGQIANEDVIRLMKVCDFFIMPSNRVAFDMVILEAISSGITVICSSDGGNKEIITDGENGYIIDNVSPQSIANIVLNNRSLKSFKQDTLVTIKDMVKNYINIYMSLIKNDGY
jgi:glycosyltransferase involved in cell wall biosynthesis